MRKVHADKWGPAGSVVAALCCLGAAPVVWALGAMGLGFFVNDLILIPLLLGFLGATVWALRRDRPRHGRGAPLFTSILGATMTLGGLWISGIVVGAGLALLLTGSVWNWALVRRA